MPKVGFKFSPESIERMKTSHLGQIAWNKGKKVCRHSRRFYKRTRNGAPFCIKCKRRNSARYRAANIEQINFRNTLGRYRLTEERFEMLWDSQKGCCAICLRPLSKQRIPGRYVNFRIDHDPVTGVRGILCHSCNTGIGLLKHSQANFERAIQYVRAPLLCI
jgi:hypothetical protein